MLSRIAFGVLLLFSRVALADQFYVAAGVNCNADIAELSIWFRGAWNNEGEVLLSSLGEGSINPMDMVGFEQDANGVYIIHIKELKLHCSIGRTEYEVTLAPYLSPRFHPEGNCASRIGASAKVESAGKIISKRTVDACNETGVVTTLIQLHPELEPIYTETPAEVFFNAKAPV